MAQWLGSRLSPTDWHIITRVADWPVHEPGINYSDEPLPFANYQICPQGLLHQQGTEQPEITPMQAGAVPAFFGVSGGHHAFDLLAASFYLITRYEEYYSAYELDEYGRYSHTNSVLFKNGWLKRPLVDEWVFDLKQRLLHHFPHVQLGAVGFKYLPTYDVDIAWSYLQKGWLRNIGGAAKDLLAGQWKRLQERASVLAGKEPDPSDRFTELHSIHQINHHTPIYFFLLADAYHGYDKNINKYSALLKALIQQQMHQAAVGIHCSWAASKQPSKMKEEITYLQNLINAAVVRNRMHYIKFQLPDTYRQLNALGIKEEYSMGYGSINGFRAGTSHPYYWYNLQDENETDLQMFPFACMDANNIFEQKDSPEQALQEWQALYKAVQKTGGTFISIAHNHLLANDASGQPWWKMYTAFLTHA